MVIMILGLLYTGLMMDKPVFTGSSSQVMSLASGMNHAFGGGSGPSWMESRKIDTPIVKIRVCIPSNGETEESGWHLEIAESVSENHVDLTREEIKFLHRYKLD
jgi:hypothetical protein